jgi:hypothetical protein
MFTEVLTSCTVTHISTFSRCLNVAQQNVITAAAKSWKNTNKYQAVVSCTQTKPVVTLRCYVGSSEQNCCEEGIVLVAWQWTTFSSSQK